jgi:hypothetical protein
MIDLVICSMDIFCHFGNIKNQLQTPKYPVEVISICQYYDEQKMTLPDYCKLDTKPIRRRSEF